MLFRIKLNPASFNDLRQNPGLLARLKGRLSVSQGCDNFQRRLYRWMISPGGFLPLGVGVCFVAWQRHPRSPRSDWPRLAFPVLASLLTPSPIRPPCSYYRIHPIPSPMETIVLGAKCTHERARAKKRKEKKKHSATRPHEREELEVIRCNGAMVQH